jgi:hypothetical protein
LTALGYWHRLLYLYYVEHVSLVSFINSCANLVDDRLRTNWVYLLCLGHLFVVKNYYFLLCIDLLFEGKLDNASPCKHCAELNFD